MKKIAEVILFWLIPFGGLALFSFLNHTDQWLTDDNFVFRLFFPALMVYLLVFTSAGWLNLWTFRVKYALGGILPQIGLIYTTVANLLAWVLHPFWSDAPVMFVVLMGVGGAIAGATFDYFAIYYRLLEVRIQWNNPDWDARSVVFSYAPRFFGMIALIIGLGFLAGSRWMEMSDINPMVAAFVIAFLGFLPFGLYLYFVMTKIKKRKKMRASNRL